MYPADDLTLSPTLQICQSGLISIPGLCLHSSSTASTCLLAFSAFCICRLWIGQHTHWHPNGWQDMTKFGHVQTKHCFLPSKPLNCGRWCHSKWQWFCGIQLSTIRLSAKTARTGNNLRLSNIGTSPSAFRWHLLSMMHMSCILLMISCCSLTLQKCQSRLVSIPGLCLHSSTTASTCLLAFSAFCICRQCIGQGTHTHTHTFTRKVVDKIWQSLATCKLNTCCYPQNPSTVADVIPSGSGFVDSVVHYQTISHVQQLILVATWSCPTSVRHPSPFADIFWAWCTCHVSCWWSHVAHWPFKFVKVV